LFSAAVVFYELLAGEKPFHGNVEALTYQICQAEARPPSQVAMLPLPPAIDALFAKALAKSPDERFQTAREFRVALGDALGSFAAEGASSDLTLVNLQSIQAPTVTPKDWDDVILTTAEKELARYVGPLAKLLVRKAAAQTHDVGELYTILATNIGDPLERRRFIAEPHAAVAIASTSRPSPGVRTGGRTSPGAGASHASTPDRGRTTHSGKTVTSRPLEQAFVDATVSRLAVYLGPIAKVVAKKAAQQAESEDEFVLIVAGYIGTQDRMAFLREMGHTD
jgi:serine/threonine-protein kinase